MFTHTAEVTANAKSEDGKTVSKSQPYTKLVFHGTGFDNEKDQNIVVNGSTPEQLLAETVQFVQDEEEKEASKNKEYKAKNPILVILQGYTYSRDLGVRAGIRQGLMAALEGPDKAIEKAAADFVKARAALGKPVTIEAAREHMKKMLAAEL